jgi:hypothetical protein
MDLNPATLEPAAAAPGKLLGFLQFDHAQDIPVEAPGLVFSARGHGKLNVIDRSEGDIWHFCKTRHMSDVA